MWGGATVVPPFRAITSSPIVAPGPRTTRERAGGEPNATSGGGGPALRLRLCRCLFKSSEFGRDLEKVAKDGRCETQCPSSRLLVHPYV
jgi:hypothetical protein